MLSDDDLLIRLRNFEDPFTERKVESDVNDVLKTAVAFANSLPLDAPGVIFIPAKNDGLIQDGVDLDRLQKNITRRLNSAYPPLPTTYKILRVANQQIVAVVVWGSKERPHFAGPAYVRKGSESINASEQEFAALVAQRSSKFYEISQWIGKRVTVKFNSAPGALSHTLYEPGVLIECNQFYASVKLEQKGMYAVSLSIVELSFDHARQCLVLDLPPGRA